MRLFQLADPNILPNLKESIINIKNIINTNCQPLPSLPQVINLNKILVY